MNLRHSCIFLSASIVFASTWIVTTSSAEDTRANATHAAPTIEDLAFLSGGWSGEMFGGVGEEFWAPPKGGSIVAAFRLMRDDKTVMTEYILVLEEEDGVYMRFKHFNNDYTTWEKDEPNTFKLVEVSNDRAVFIAPSETQQLGHLIYHLDGDTLKVKVGAGQDITNEKGAMNLAFARLH